MAVRIIVARARHASRGCPTTQAGERMRARHPRRQRRDLRPHPDRARQARHGHHHHRARAAARALPHRPGRATAGPTCCATARFHQLTKDHSYVQEQVDAGLLTPEQARVHPYSNVITRCVGASVDVVPDIYFGAPRSRATCSCWPPTASPACSRTSSWRRSSGRRAGPQRWVDRMITEANRRGGLDNITAIVDPDRRGGPAHRRASHGRGRGGGAELVYSGRSSLIFALANRSWSSGTRTKPCFS